MDYVTNSNEATFKALNIEYDDVSEVEVDDTRELQIEDALKLYQSALKYHSEGPASYEKALQAYKELFESDIFKYPESQSELRRLELFSDASEYDLILLQEQVEAGESQLAVPVDTTPNTLQQILHLAYKNHGQFVLDLLQYNVRNFLQQNATAAPDRSQIADAAKKPLEYFAEALDKDDADLDLWRSTSSVAETVGSTRIARYCLESVLDGDEEGLDMVLSLPGVEEAFALQNLHELVQKLQDDLSAALAPLSNFRQIRLAKALSQRLKGSQSIPKPNFEDAAYSLAGHLGKPPTRYVITTARRDWTSVGDTILQQLALESGGLVDVGPGVGVGFRLPEPSIPDVSMEMPIRPSPREKPLETPTDDIRAGDKDRTVPEKMPASEDVPNGTGAREAEKGKEMEEAPVTEADAVNGKEESKDTAPDESGPPVTRKRSTSSAGFPEAAEGGRARSKRIRTRDAPSAGETTVEDVNQQYQDRLQDFISADEWLFDSVGSILSKFSVEGLGSAQVLRESVSQKSGAVHKPQESGLETAIQDFFELSQNCTPEKTAVLATTESVDRLAEAPVEFGFHTVAGARSTDDSASDVDDFDDSLGIEEWVNCINATWSYNKDTAWQWLKAFLRPGSFSGIGKYAETSLYRLLRWSDDLKRVVVQIAIHNDEYVYRMLQRSIAALERRILDTDKPFQCDDQDRADIEMIQTLFELHLDVYKRFKHPGSGIDVATQNNQMDRLERWSILSNTAINLRDENGSRLISEEQNQDTILILRHLWAIVFQLSASDDVPQSLVVADLDQLREELIYRDVPPIRLVNNAVMPEISVAAVEKALNEINMQDLFRKVFSHDEKDPVAVIEGLEPLLESAVTSRDPSRESTARQNSPDGSKTAGEEDPAEEMGEQDQNVTDKPLEEMRKFLANGTVSLRLTLWQRLRLAYDAIQYPSKVLSCHLRSIELLIHEFEEPSYTQAAKEQRGFLLLRWLKMIDEFLLKVLEVHKNAPDPFECIDDVHLQSSMSAVASLSRILHTFNIYEDQVRVGQLPAPMFEGRVRPSFLAVANKIYDMQIHTWIVQYLLLKEAINQDPEKFSTPAEDRLEFLRSVHYALGLRTLCSRANGALLKLERDELLELSDLENSDIELCQVLFDLYGIKCFINPADLIEHGCSGVDSMTRGRAIKILGFIMSQATKIPMKDIPKTELKNSIDKVHGWLGKPRYTEDLQLNGRIVRAFLRGPVNPLDMFSAIRGTLELPVKPIPESEASIHSKGWFALMGNISLSKFRSQKRLQPGPTEDLNFAIAFYLQDLEYSTERWESWYHLGQCYDLQLEEGISWTAEKVNTYSLDIQQQQRGAIHCYSMAVAAVLRNTDVTSEHKTKVAELFTDLANRIYSSSREPLSMRAFMFRDIEEKFYSGREMYKMAPFQPLRVYTAWKFAATLFQQSISRVSDNWITHYMLGKCRWKMYAADESIRGDRKAPTMQEVLDCFRQAIEASPNKKGKEPILEPHYKLVSVVHKLVLRKDLDVHQASDILRATPYASKIEAPDDAEKWSEYVLKVLRELRSADKSNWHHRMTFRAATIIYEDSDRDLLGAMGSKHELTQQMFTKTMQMQVWKPENERPGRHFVYTSRYLRFFVGILVQTKDRQNLEALVRRLRRKPHDFFDHTKLWQETCLAYLKLLRQAGQVPEGYEDHVFKSMNHEDFSTKSAKLEAWCHAPTTSSTTLEILRDVIELKKLNNGLMKPTLIDDLLCDTYAKLYEDASPLLDAAPAPNGVAGVDGPSDDAAHPPQMNLQFQPGYQPGQPQPPEQHVPRPRAKGVGRRELQRKAEAAVNRPVAATVASIAPRPMNGGQTIQVVIPPSHTSIDGSANSAGASGAAGLAPPGQQAVEHSVPGSVHDSADDESGSELSELDEEPTPPRLMFPGLAARMASKESPTPNSSQVGGEGDDEKGEADAKDGEDEVMEDVKEE